MKLGDDVGMTMLVRDMSQKISELTGISLGEKQSHMVEARLRGRMLKLGVTTAAEYRDYLASNQDSETQNLVSLLTTHHTFFFREFVHFENLAKALPDILKRVDQRGDKTVRVWSAACSRGQEVYSLAIFLDYHLKKMGADYKVSVLGSDVDPESVKIAQNGVYRKEETSDIPIQFLSGYFAKGTGEISNFVRVKDHIRKNCRFEMKNLLNIPKVKTSEFDVIFCRNVFIYFENDLVKKISESLLSHLHEDGLLYLGTSESISSLNLPVTSLGASVYVNSEKAPAKKPEPAASQNIKVFCVDDSPSILKILGKVLVPEQGFEVIGTANNGADALQKLKTLKPDVITLDLHMPEMDGLEFVTHHQGAPVMVVSSVAKDDREIIEHLSNHGVRDYVEKPSMANMSQHAEEIRTKLKALHSYKDEKVTLKSSLDVYSRSQGQNKQSENARVHFFVDFDKLESYRFVFATMGKDLPPISIWVNGGEKFSEAYNKIQQSWKRPVEQAAKQFEAGKIYLGDQRKDFPVHEVNDSSLHHLVFVCHSPSQDVLTLIRKMHSPFVVLEENDSQDMTSLQLNKIADDVSPSSSFSYFVRKWCQQLDEEKAG